MHALIIVDVQAGFNVPETVIGKIRARAGEFPLRIYTQFINAPGSLFRTKLKRDSCGRDDPGARLVFEPQPHDLVLEKTGYGLTEAQIETIHTRGVKELTVAGVDTDACVLGVMYSLWDRGIDVHIDPELCWSSIGLHKQAVEIAHQQFGK